MAGRDRGHSGAAVAQASAQAGKRDFQGPCLLDIHDPAENVKVLGRKVSGKSMTIIQLVRSYTSKYRCLVPESTDNLLAAGRCLSPTHEAAASTWGMAVCMASGEAAGTAAVMAAVKGIRPRDLAIDEVRVRPEQYKAVLKRPGFARLGVAGQQAL